MVRRHTLVVSVVLFAFSLLWVSGCRRGVVKEEVITGEETQRAVEREGIVEDELEAARRKVEELRKKPGLKLSTVYFSLDDFSLSEMAKENLMENAAWMLNNPQKRIMIEGHCCELGTNEYNLALGQRRADSAKRYLLSLGVGSGQLSTISYGEERPADRGRYEEAYKKNRRAEFVEQ